MTQETSPRGAHLVGSITLESVEDVFLTSVREIGGHLEYDDERSGAFAVVISSGDPFSGRGENDT